MPTAHPSIRLHPSETSNPMLAPSPFIGGGAYEGGYMSVPRGFKDRQFHHKRASSGSSVASAGPPSPLSQSTLNPRIATSDATYSPHYDFDFSHSPHANASKMPAMMYQPGFDSVDMRRIHSTGADDRASYAAQSVSSMSHNSPATPHTNYDNDYDDKIFAGKTAFDDMDFQYLQDLGYPSAAYQQSLQDVFPDQSFAPMAFAQQQRPPQNMIHDRLQAAQQDHLRTSSPIRRDRSPFKPSSDFMPAPQRTQQVPTLQKQRTSISPKELMLGEHDVDEPTYALFPADNYNRRTKSNLSNSYSMPQESLNVAQQYPFVSQRSQDDFNETPDFPAHLISMESTNEEGPSLPSSQQSLPTRPRREDSAKPVDTSSDAGTYSCTYHGCHLRFDSPAKLQKHKREGHRQQSPTSSQSAKTSQAGPHRCERINPQTGKPCNSIFSRPYDLTRHEDTIHNARKQKVRCHLCTEEKTFSRNDALTRHMRVVHPDVDWVGKTRRKSQK